MISYIDISGCIKTEWFDTDDPCILGDYESHFGSMKSIVPYKRTRRFRNCLVENKGGKQNSLNFCFIIPLTFGFPIRY